MLKPLLLIGFLVLLPVVLLAQGSDPFIGVTGDGLRPMSLATQLNTVQPTSAACEDNGGDCNFIFINDTGEIITDFEFDTSAFSLSDPSAYNYSCSSGYFLDCTATLNSLGDGMYDLDYSFYGVDPYDGHGYSSTNESGLPEGIAPGDTFYISLDGWSGVFQDLTLTNSFSVPEASSILILLTELLLLAGLARLLGLRWHRSSRTSVQPE